MIKKLLTAAGILVSTLMQAQISNDVISSAGGTDRTPQISLDWVLGESFVESISSKQIWYTQGFLQPLLQTETNKRFPIFDRLNVVIAPNPVQSIATVKVLNQNHSKLLLTLYDMNGRVMLTQTIAENQQMTSMNLSNLSHATYVLQIRNSDASLLKTLMIDKVK